MTMIFKSISESVLGKKNPGLEFVAPPTMVFEEGQKGKGLFRAKSGLTLFREKPEVEDLRDDDECLPEEWEVLFDADLRHEYYYNKKTGVSTWERPVDMKPQVVLHKDKTPSEVSRRSTSSSTRRKRDHHNAYKEEARSPYTTEDRGRIPTNERCYYFDFLTVAAAELRNNRVERPSRQKRPLWRVIRREAGITDAEIEFFFKNPDDPTGGQYPFRDIHNALNHFFDEHTNPKEKTIDELMNFMMQFEQESVLQAQAIAKFDPLDFIDCVRERWNLVNLPCDKTSLNQIATMFVGILSLRDITDGRRVVREETVLATADPKTKILANQNAPMTGAK